MRLFAKVGQSLPVSLYACIVRGCSVLCFRQEAAAAAGAAAGGAGGQDLRTEAEQLLKDLGIPDSGELQPSGGQSVTVIVIAPRRERTFPTRCQPSRTYSRTSSLSEL